MTNFLSVLGNIIIFLLCLSVVVCLHEAGHLAAAKFFDVYCFEYSIGFGPAIFKKKFKHKKKAKKSFDPLYQAPSDEKVEGETQFSIRALPLGGYVAMAGEDANETEDGVVIPEKRTLNGINHAKQLVIMLAGITVNFILAYLLFFINYAFCPQQRNKLESNTITVSQYSDDDKTVEYAAYHAGLRSGDRIISLYQEYNGLLVYNEDEPTSTMDKVYWPYEPTESKPLPVITKYSDYVVENPNSYDQLTRDSMQYYLLDIFTARANGILTLPDNLAKVFPGPNSTRTFYFTYQRTNEAGVEEIHTLQTEAIGTSSTQVSKNVDVYSFDLLGITPEVETFRYGFGQSFGLAGNMFGQLFTGIYKAIGHLFTPAGWKNVGGIVSVYRMSASGVKSRSIGNFIFLWGYISLNLGCFNLLPLPGLDGWQSMIAILESITRKKFPKKFKNIANTVGLIVLLVLAALLVIKDFL